MNDTKEKYLPIGTVVMLKGATKRVMITGFCSLEETNQEKIWDYSGCFYPEGVLSSNQICLFDHEQIDKIHHMGLADDNEERDFKARIKDILAMINNDSTEPVANTEQ